MPLHRGNLEAWKRELEAWVAVAFRKNEQDFLYGIAYVDHPTKSVFNGSELGKEYSAAAIRQRSMAYTAHSETITTQTETPRKVETLMKPAPDRALPADRVPSSLKL